MCPSVCAFLDDYPGTMARLVGGLRPGGLFVQWDWELDPADAEPWGLTREALEHAGLEVLAVETALEVPFEQQVMRPLVGAGRSR